MIGNGFTVPLIADVVDGVADGFWRVVFVRAALLVRPAKMRAAVRKAWWGWKIGDSEDWVENMGQALIEVGKRQLPNQ